MKVSIGIAALGAAIALAGCQTAQQEAPSQVWTKTDGRRLNPGTAAYAQGELDLTYCKGETQKAAVGQAPVYYQGLAGAISAGIIVDQRNKALVDILKGCMAGRGYVLTNRELADQRGATRGRG